MQRLLKNCLQISLNIISVLKQINELLFPRKTIKMPLLFVIISRVLEIHQFAQIHFNPLSANPRKWSNTHKQFVGWCKRIVWPCLTILWGWRLKGKGPFSDLTKSPLKVMKNVFWFTLKLFSLLRFGILNSLSANFTKWSNTLKKFVGRLTTNCLSVFDHLWDWHLKG